MKKRLVYGAVGFVFIAGLVSTLAPDGSVASNASMVLVTFLFAPLLILAFLVLCFAVYHWVAHGDPFHESRTGNWLRPSDRPREAEPKTRELKICPICKVRSRCRVTRSKGGKFWVHVVRS